MSAVKIFSGFFIEKIFFSKKVVFLHHNFISNVKSFKTNNQIK